MFKRTIYPVLMLLILMFLFSCSDNPTESADALPTEMTLYLMGLDSDPIGLEANSESFAGMPFGHGSRGGRFGFGGGERPAFCMDAIGHLLDVLQLSQEQLEQIEAKVNEYKAAFDELNTAWQNGEVAWQDIHGKRRELREAFIADITPVLTEEQQTILADMQNRFKGGHTPEEMVERRMQRLTETLNLTTEQQDKIRDILVAAGDELITLRDNSTSREEFHEAARTVIENVQTQIAGELNEDQLATFNELPARGKGHRWHG
jgi:hypothetical protein